jgi:outer membrane protein TolC
VCSSDLEISRSGLIPQAGLQVSAALSAYTVGKVDFMALLESQMALYRTELDYHQALTEYEKGLSTVEFLVGRGLF